MADKRSMQRQESDRTKRAGLVSRLFSLIVTVPLTLFVTMIVSIIVEWCGIYWKWWDMPGASHALNMLQVEATYINAHFTGSVMGSSPIKAAALLVDWLDSYVFDPIGIGELKVADESQQGFGWDYWVSAYYMVKIAILRFTVLFFSLWVFLLFALVGLTTGLVERDLRRFGVGREHADRFALAKRLVNPAVVLCFVLYLSWPDIINPAWIVVPFAALFGFSLHLMASLYKKTF